MSIRTIWKHGVRGSMVCGALFMACTGVARAATVRGKAGCAAARRQTHPATGYYFTVYNATIGRSKRASVGQDGAFYLYNIPNGSYLLEAWTYANTATAAKVFQFVVYEPYTDIPQVVLDC